MTATVDSAIQPLAPFIKIDEQGAPYLEGLRCSACNEVIVGAARRACPKCATVGALHPIKLADHGKVYTYTIVHRSFPGVQTPFVSALVDLAGGGVIKGNLCNVSPGEVEFDMPVRVVFEDVAVEKQGATRYVRHIFVRGS